MSETCEHDARQSTTVTDAAAMQNGIHPLRPAYPALNAL